MNLNVEDKNTAWNMHKNRMKLYLSIAVISEEKYWQYILRWDGHDGTSWTLSDEEGQVEIMLLKGH